MEPTLEQKLPAVSVSEASLPPPLGEAGRAEINVVTRDDDAGVDKVVLTGARVNLACHAT